MTTNNDTENSAAPENNLGERLRVEREKRGLSQEGLSRLTKICDSEKQGISRTVLTGYEKGKFKPGTRELRVLYETLNLTPNWLVLGQADPKRIQSKFKSEQEFESELLKAFRKLDSDSLNGITHLIFAASTNISELNAVVKPMHKAFEGLSKALDEAKKNVLQNSATTGASKKKDKQ